MEDQHFFGFLERETGVVMNEMQKEAISHPMGPLLLLATPGAGKTTVLIARILYLILCLGVNPENILALTFSKAAGEKAVSLTTFKLEKGADIRHKAFGIGRITVADVEDDLLEVNFRKLGIKKFSLKVCLEGKLVSSVL